MTANSHSRTRNHPQNPFQEKQDSRFLSDTSDNSLRSRRGCSQTYLEWLLHSGAHGTATCKARADTKKATIHSYTFCPTPAQLDEHKHGSCWEKKLLRKQRDEDWTKATAVRTAIVSTATRDAHGLSVHALRGQGQRFSSAVSHGSDWTWEQLSRWVDTASRFLEVKPRSLPVSEGMRYLNPVSSTGPCLSKPLSLTHSPWHLQMELRPWFPLPFLNTSSTMFHSHVNFPTPYPWSWKYLAISPCSSLRCTRQPKV